MQSGGVIEKRISILGPMGKKNVFQRIVSLFCILTDLYNRILVALCQTKLCLVYNNYYSRTIYHSSHAVLIKEEKKFPSYQLVEKLVLIINDHKFNSEQDRLWSGVTFAVGEIYSILS